MGEMFKDMFYEEKMVMLNGRHCSLNWMVQRSKEDQK